MNRAQRRSQIRRKSNVRKTGLTYLTVAGVLGGSLGMSSPAQALLPPIPQDYVATDCESLKNGLGGSGATTGLTATGGSLTANFSDPACVLTTSYEFLFPSKITGPANRSLTLQFDETGDLFKARNAFEVSNLNFKGTPNAAIFGSFIYAWNDPIKVTNSTFSDASLSAAIYAEGNLTVADSVFTKLVSVDSGSAIALNSGRGRTSEITNSTFDLNSAGGRGGAIDFDNNAEGSLIVSNSTFTRNESPIGGAIWSNGKLQVNGSSFSENNASLSSGAIHNGGDGELSVTDSAFDSNKALYAGGAIFSEGGLSLTVQDSSFIANGETTSDGGAITVDSSEVRIGNSTFSENIGAQGAALYISLGEGSSPTVTNSTFWNNKSSDVTSGSVVGLGSPISFFGNILANNDSSNVISEVYPSIVDLGANLYTDDSFVPDAGRSGEGASRAVTATSLDLGTGIPSLNTTMPTNLGTTKTIALGPNSIARDFYTATSAGIQPQNPVLYSGFDQRGVARPIGTGYDVGAYEYGVDPAVVMPVAKATIAAQSIKFAPGSSKLSKAAKKQLRELAAEIQTKGLKTLNLQGYTATYTKASPSGKILRVKLSKARSTAVEKYLKQQFKKSGYAVTFTKSAKGAANPVKSNKTEKGRKDNRRVEIVID